MAGPRAFICSHMKDEWSRNRLVKYAEEQRSNDIEFFDYPEVEVLDGPWKTNCKIQIAQTKGTIVVVGEETYMSNAVLWAIDETARQDHYLLGVRIDQHKAHPIPLGLTASSIVGWDFRQIVKWLNTWS